MYKIIINEHDFLNYDVILKNGKGIVSIDKDLNDMEAESCILSIYHSYNLPRDTKIISRTFEDNELIIEERLTLEEFLEVY